MRLFGVASGREFGQLGSVVSPVPKSEGSFDSAQARLGAPALIASVIRGSGPPADGIFDLQADVTKRLYARC